MRALDDFFPWFLGSLQKTEIRVFAKVSETLKLAWFRLVSRGQ